MTPKKCSGLNGSIRFYLKRRIIWDRNCERAYPPIFKKLKRIRTTLIDHTGSVDTAILLLKSWSTEDSFSTTKAYNWLRCKSEGKSWMRFIWRRYIPPKFSFFLWLSLRGRLYTKNKWLADDEKMCSFCKTSLETIDHLFF